MAGGGYDGGPPPPAGTAELESIGMDIMPGTAACRHSSAVYVRGLICE